MSNRAKEIYEAAVSYEAKIRENMDYGTAYDLVWMTQCTDEERREALRMLDARAAGRST